jgi:tricorn protease
VDKLSGGQVGYVHLRAMTTVNYYEFVRQYYAAADKGGLVLDLRYNGGGNIDSWILSRLMRPAWHWWAARDGDPTANFQNSFRGHLVVLVNAWTASDGETMANGVRQLKLGEVLGTRTWGGGIWLRGGINALVDKGYARAAETGTYIPGQGWQIEGDGLTPDVIIDNNPVAGFRGEDTQLEAAIKRLQEKIAKAPKHLLPAPPPYPDKSLKK